MATGEIVKFPGPYGDEPLPSYADIMADVEGADGSLGRFATAERDCEDAIIDIANQHQVCVRCLVGTLVNRLTYLMDNGTITHAGGPDDGTAA